MKYKSVLAAILLIMGASAFASEEQSNSFRWQCRNTGKNGMQCYIKNTGYYNGSICMDVVKVCEYGEHVAKFCSGGLEPLEVATKVVAYFEPRVGENEPCMGIEYRNKETN